MQTRKHRKPEPDAADSPRPKSNAARSSATTWSPKTTTSPFRRTTPPTAAPWGVGIELPGDYADLVEGNTITNNPTDGVLAFEYPNPFPPGPTTIYFQLAGNKIANNTFSGNGYAAGNVRGRRDDDRRPVREPGIDEQLPQRQHLRRRDLPGEHRRDMGLPEQDDPKPRTAYEEPFAAIEYLLELQAVSEHRAAISAGSERQPAPPPQETDGADAVRRSAPRTRCAREMSVGGERTEALAALLEVARSCRSSARPGESRTTPPGRASARARATASRMSGASIARAGGAPASRAAAIRRGPVVGTPMTLAPPAATSTTELRVVLAAVLPAGDQHDLAAGKARERRERRLGRGRDAVVDPQAPRRAPPPARAGAAAAGSPERTGQRRRRDAERFQRRQRAAQVERVVLAAQRQLGARRDQLAVQDRPSVSASHPVGAPSRRHAVEPIATRAALAAGRVGEAKLELQLVAGVEHGARARPAGSAGAACPRGRPARSRASRCARGRGW